MAKTKYIYSSILALTLTGLTSCVDNNVEPEISQDSMSLSVRATIESMNTFQTRVATTMKHDGWSYSSFKTGDVLGLYSDHGDYFKAYGEDEIINLPMTFDGYSFKNENNFQFSPSRMTVDGIYMYFPWCENMVNAEGGSLGAEGLELRRTDPDDPGYLKCIDFLDITELSKELLSGGALVGKFKHAFSELIIMRGEGFDTPPDGKDQIWVVMQNPYTHVNINFTLEPSWSCSPTLTYDENYIPAGYNGPEPFDAKRWQAWRGGNYTITDEDKVGVPAWYVLLPCLGENNPDYMVTSIELYDNDGNLQKVTNLSLSPKPGSNNQYTKILSETWRYPLLVEMKELVPTVKPYPIIPWEGDTNLTNERGRGIENAFDFQQWLNYYITYLNDGEYDHLLKYGDRVVDTDGNFLYWHFYLLNDIDLSKRDNEEGNSPDAPLIPEFRDILDGINHNEMENNKHPNYSITGLTQTFIGTMSENATLQNIDFISPNVISSSLSPVGILVNTLTSTSVGSGGDNTVPLIDNCTIQYGSLMSQGYVGFVAGQMTNATISNCSVDGFMVGYATSSTSPYFNMVGSGTGTNYIENNVSNVLFNPLNQ